MSLIFAIRIWWRMEWRMFRAGMTPEQKRECWDRLGKYMDGLKAELQKKIDERQRR
jgi:hypothetical protein